MRLEDDDAVLSVFEWMDWLEEQPELDVPAGARDPKKFVVLLSDHIHTVDCKLWGLLLGKPPNCYMDT